MPHVTGRAGMETEFQGLLSDEPLKALRSTCCSPGSTSSWSCSSNAPALLSRGRTPC